MAARASIATELDNSQASDQEDSTLPTNSDSLELQSNGPFCSHCYKPVFSLGQSSLDLHLLSSTTSFSLHSYFLWALSLHFLFCFHLHRLYTIAFAYLTLSFPCFRFYSSVSLAIISHILLQTL